VNPRELAKTYDKVAAAWQAKHDTSRYGLAQLERAIELCSTRNRALDVGCGAGGRMIRVMQSAGFDVTGIDVSAEMVRRARETHSDLDVVHDDICEWETDNRYDLIVAWDSNWHLPLDHQRPVVAKLCSWLAHNGVLLFTFADMPEGQTEDWVPLEGHPSYYSSLGAAGFNDVLNTNGVDCVHVTRAADNSGHPHIIGRKR
jgi:trans-aconitate methyltransferase